MRRRIHLVCAAVISLTSMSLYLPLTAMADEGSHVSFPSMTEDEIDRFRDSLKNQVPLLPVSPRASEEIPKNVELAWSGIVSDVVTQVGEIVLRFKPLQEEILSRSVTSANDPNALLGQVDLSISSTKFDVRFVHSNPQNLMETAGFKAPFKTDAPRTRVKVITGQRDSSMYVAVPPYQNPEQLWGIYVCPRSFNYKATARDGSKTVSAERSPYALAEVLVSFEASGATTYEAARDKVRAAVTLQLSKELPDSNKSSDVAISAVAEPRVRYVPIRPFSFHPFPDSNNMQQGLNLLVEHQNRAGHIRRENFRHVVSIHKSDEFSPVPISISGVQPAADIGDCYFVQAQRYSWKEYDQGSVSF